MARVNLRVLLPLWPLLVVVDEDRMETDETVSTTTATTATAATATTTATTTMEKESDMEWKAVLWTTTPLSTVYRVVLDVVPVPQLITTPAKVSQTEQQQQPPPATKDDESAAEWTSTPSSSSSSSSQQGQGQGIGRSLSPSSSQSPPPAKKLDTAEEKASVREMGSMELVGLVFRGQMVPDTPSQTLADLGVSESEPNEFIALFRPKRPSFVPSQLKLPVPGPKTIESVTQQYPDATDKERGITKELRAPHGTIIKLIRAAAAPLIEIGRQLQGEVIKTTTPEETQEAELPDVNEETLQTITSMGYNENQARKALLLNRLSPMLAADWLVSHSGDPDLEQPLTTAQRRRIISRQSNFKPNPQAIERLLNMGFNRYDVIAALRFTNNNVDLACNWLLGDRDGASTMMDNEEEAEEGSALSPESTEIQMLLKDPVVLEGLLNASLIKTLRSYMTGEISIFQLFSEPDISPWLSRVGHVLKSELEEATDGASDAATQAAVAAAIDSGDESTDLDESNVLL